MWLRTILAKPSLIRDQILKLVNRVDNIPTLTKVVELTTRHSKSTQICEIVITNEVMG